jgi:hypothetical protein
MLNLKLLEKQEQAFQHSKARKRRQIRKIRTKINETESNKQTKYKESMKQKVCSLKK